MRLSNVAFAVSGLLAAFGPRAGCALEWRHVPVLGLRAGYDTNIRLEPESESAVASAATTARADIVGRDERFSIRFSPRASSIRYDDPRELDRTDAFADLELAVTEARERWSLGAGYAREGTLTSEFDGSGFVETGIARTRSSWTTSWTRAPSERTSYAFTAAAVAVDYEEALFSPLVDYRYTVLQAAYSRAVSERGGLRFTATHSDVASRAVRITTTSNELRFVYTRELSSALTGSIGAGTFEVSRSGTISSVSSGNSLDFSLDRRWERWSFDAEGRRELRPDGRGALVREDALELRATRRIAERVSLDLTLRAASRSPVGREELSGRDYAQGGFRVRWRFGQRWSLSSSLMQRAQRYGEGPESRALVGAVAVEYGGR